MRLEYRILWCEDDLEWCEPAKDYLEGHLKDLGFLLHVDQVRSEKIEELEARLSSSKSYDLILMDYKFNGQHVGDIFIQKIRSQDIYSEVVFYSAEPQENLYAAVSAKRLDGVYVAPRADGFYDKVEKVIATTIKKVLDVNAMRGIAMAATSKIDKRVYEIIKVYYEQHISDPDKKTSFEKIISQRIKAYMSKKLNNYDGETSSSTKFWRHISSTANFFTNLRLETLTEDILKSGLKAEDKGNEFNAIYEAVLKYSDTTKKRNKLAHEEETETTDADGKITIKVGTYIFDEAEALNLRKDLVLAEEKIGELWEKLRQQ